MKKKIEDKKDQENTCENCRYFLHHYVKIRTQIKSICCGHCINSNIQTTRKRVQPESIACKLWEPIQIQIDERKENIKLTLQFMQTQLEQIALLLSDDANLIDMQN